MEKIFKGTATTFHLAPTIPKRMKGILTEIPEIVEDVGGTRSKAERHKRHEHFRKNPRMQQRPAQKRWKKNHEVLDPLLWAGDFDQRQITH